MNGVINTPVRTDIMYTDGAALKDLHSALKTLEMLQYLN